MITHSVRNYTVANKVPFAIPALSREFRVRATIVAASIIMATLFAHQAGVNMQQVVYQGSVSFVKGVQEGVASDNALTHSEDRLHF